MSEKHEFIIWMALFVGAHIGTALWIFRQMRRDHRERMGIRKPPRGPGFWERVWHR